MRRTRLKSRLLPLLPHLQSWYFYCEVDLCRWLIWQNLGFLRVIFEIPLQNWENRPKIIGRKAKNRVYFLFTAEFRSKITCSVFLGYWEIPRNNWSLKWSYFREENWHFQLNLIHFFLAEGVGNISLFAFFSRCDDGKAKKDKGWHQRVPKKRRKKENRVRSQAGSNLEGKVYKSNALPTGL